MTTASQPQSRPFQAEVKQVLDIVIHSLYTHREIFVRELVSNAADALEKVRYEKVKSESIADPDLPLEIRIEVDEKAKNFTITDAGIGMTEEEAVRNLGTIAHSGTREFLQHVGQSPSQDVNLIGKFGVGFYSSFMVAKKVTVRTRSFHPEAAGIEWQSDGSGEYSIQTVEGLPRGTRIELDLRENAEEYALIETVKRIVKEYSNFVPFPILINGEKVNTIQAIWTRGKNEISDEEYNEFYKFIAKAWDDPTFRLHFSVDAPLQINALLFTPTENMEKFGFGRMEPGVNLYCRRVLIQANCKEILPEWLRFVRGVVDSEDLPLNISRETFQDNALIRKLRKVLATRFLKFLGEQAKSDSEGYIKFWKTFNTFLKEGIATDHEYRDELLPLLRFESSKSEPGTLVSLEDYVGRMKLEQKSIYYLNASTREAIETGPYMETFKKRDIEVLYTYEPIDDFVMNHIHEYKEKKLVSGDQGDLDLPPTYEKEEEITGESLNRDQADSLTGWIQGVLGDRVTAVRPSKRLVDSPAIIVNQDAGMTVQMQRVMQAMNKDMPSMGRYSLEINTGHPIVIQLERRRQKNPDDPFLKVAVEQIYENAMAIAGVLTDSRTLLNRNYEILQRALGEKSS